MGLTPKLIHLVTLKITDTEKQKKGEKKKEKKELPSVTIGGGT